MESLYNSASTTSLDSSWLSRRSPVFSQYGCVASSQPLATAAGIEILRRGGTAADAAIAVASTLAVTEPCSTGLGGDYFMLYYDAKTRKVTAINGSGRSAAELTYERAVSEAASSGSENKMNAGHAHCVTVPGAVRGWEDTIKRHGKLSLAENLSQAADIATCGFPVAPVTANLWAKLAHVQIAKWQGVGDAVAPEELLVQDMAAPQGLRAPRAGEIFKRPQVAQVLREIGQHGADVFYNEGWISDALVDAVQACGGALNKSDLHSHTRSTFPDPIAVNYRGVDVYEHPPNGQGLCALIALNILNHLPEELLGLHADPTQRTHVMIESLRLAFADARRFIADPAYVNQDGVATTAAMATACPSELVEALLSAEYGQERAKMVNVLPSGSSNSDIQHGVPLSSCDTVSFQVVDAYGNAASVVNSNYEGFGSGIVPKGLGFSLQNRGANFSTEKGHPNQIAPKKRPYHTIIPGMALKDGNLWCTFTNMGGFMQPQGHVQLLSNMLDLGMDPQSAIDCPRWCISQQGTGTIYFEEGFPMETLLDLQKRGHDVQSKGAEKHPVVVSGAARSMFGRAQIILYNAVDGVCCAGSDGRGDGCASPLTTRPKKLKSSAPSAASSAKSLVESSVESSEEYKDEGQSLTGEMFVYHKNQVCIAKRPEHKGEAVLGVVVFVPGLTDGLLGCGYVSSLATMVTEEHFVFVQPTLSSSWNGYGTSTITQDVLELDQLLLSSRLSSLPVVLIGHSTGCQDAVHYMKHGRCKQRVCSIVLQAPVSDREAMLLEATASGGVQVLQDAIAFAAEAVGAGNGTLLMPRDAPGTYGVPMTAERYLSLSGRMTAEDLFSSDLTDDELRIQNGHVLECGVDACCVLSGRDQYVPPVLLEKYDDFGQRLSTAMGGEYHVIKQADHGLQDPINQSEFVNIVRGRLKKISN
jgi:gamma-glutamyltranspeptidase/glutathione hydrolase